jgi:hypothetical protein
MEKEQDRRFRQAVQRKLRESADASRASQRTAGGDAGGIRGDQESLTREKNTRHKKVTADKWNQ